MNYLDELFNLYSIEVKFYNDNTYSILRDSFKQAVTEALAKQRDGIIYKLYCTANMNGYIPISAVEDIIKNFELEDL